MSTLTQPAVADLNNQSPVNAISIHKQNELLLAHLKAGNTINFLQARQMGIGFLNSRISDLIANDVAVFKRWIKVGKCSCKEYSLKPYDYE
jgi:hypothetical protein